MPKLSTAPAVTATTTQTVELDTRTRTKIVTELRHYAQLKAKIDALKVEQDAVKAKLSTLRDSTGETSLTIEGEGTITLVAPTYRKFNPKKFVARGGNLALYEECNEVHPKKSYDKVTLPGEKDEE